MGGEAQKWFNFGDIWPPYIWRDDVRSTYEGLFGWSIARLKIIYYALYKSTHHHHHHHPWEPPFQIQIQFYWACSQKAKNQKAKQTIIHSTTKQCNRTNEMAMQCNAMKKVSRPWKISARHAANVVRTSPYLSDRGYRVAAKPWDLKLITGHGFLLSPIWQSFIMCLNVQIGSLDHFYLFEQRRLVKRSASPSRRHHVRLEQEPRVGMMSDVVSDVENKYDLSNTVASLRGRSPRVTPSRGVSNSNGKMWLNLGRTLDKRRRKWLYDS